MTDKICKNCEYYRNNYGYGQCYGQKDAPKVDDNESCEDFKQKSTTYREQFVGETDEQYEEYKTGHDNLFNGLEEKLKKAEVGFMENDLTDKVKSEDFIKAFGEGVKQMENVKPIVIDCKYYLPCGRCDKTNGLCSMLEESNIVISTKKPTVNISTNNPFCVPIDNGGVTPV